ncbi:zinc finger protein 728-like [Pseudomyrmex gracilis]|uniref:zinc finger protein 728-like n=1 Tax=Pseudomyrmex gracilis TaxID=219809 RepID=UPI000995B1F6|nr:zinc finger protein 728-like [Pseudomyrmex gracilis]
MASTSTGVTSEASTSAEQQYQCKVCDAVFQDKSMLSAHYHSSHKHNNTFLCTKCDFTTGYLGNLKKHSSIHLNDMYYCVICRNHFHTFRELTDHENVHKCMMSNIYPCNICANTFPSFNDLRIHRIICQFCSHSFYTCWICDKHFYTQHEYNIHRDSHKCTT